MHVVDVHFIYMQVHGHCNRGQLSASTVLCKFICAYKQKVVKWQCDLDKSSSMLQQ